jgi:SAM-dependent methyltransferase
MCERLDSSGCEVLAAGRDPAVDQGQHRFVAQDLNDAGLASPPGIASFDLVVAVEGIEHAKSSIRFFRNMSPLLAPHGVAVIAAPDVDSLPARPRVPLNGKIGYTPSDPAHISAIFSDPFGRPFLPPAGLKSNERLWFAPSGDPLTDKPLARPLALPAAVFPGDSVLGDKPIFVFKAAR